MQSDQEETLGANDMWEPRVIDTAVDRSIVSNIRVPKNCKVPSST